MNLLERESRYWLSAVVGQRDERMFAEGMKQFWAWASTVSFVRLFSDGERRYSISLWKLAHCWLLADEVTAEYKHRKVWRQGLEVACKVKGSQGRPRVTHCKREHPYTAITPRQEIHANHLEAFNSSLRRRCSAYRRRQNHYAKAVSGLKRAVTALRLIHNWVREHPSLPTNTTPAMKLGAY